MNANFGFLNGEFINLYSDENPILETDDICYFLFTNDVDYHRPLIGKGVIVHDVFTDGMNKDYYIKLIEIFESPKVINDFINGKPFNLFQFNAVVKTKKLVQINPNFNFENFVFKIDAFFIRKTLEQISNLRKSYIIILRKDINKQLSDIDEILQTE